MVLVSAGSGTSAASAGLPGPSAPATPAGSMRQHGQHRGGTGTVPAMTSEPASTEGAPTGFVRTLGRVLLGLFLLTAGTGHFVAPETFLAQVPPWMPARLLIVYVSGVVELVLGAALVAGYRRVLVGWIVAAFF